MTAPINSTNIQNLIKQPLPSTMEADSAANPSPNETRDTTGKEPQRRYNRPNVGVVTPPKISQTPMADSIEIRKKENPQAKYKYIPKPKIKGNFQKIVSAGTFLTGVCAALTVLLKKK